MPRVSVVIPALNEHKALPRTLERLFAQAGDYEVIVADGGSTDATREVARSYKDVRLVEAPRGRAVQMNAGAALARGEWLVFLHADTELPVNALTSLETAGCAAGAFRHRFSHSDWRLAFISWATNVRSGWSGIYYGDQAIFVKRAVFHELGGFPPVAALEDVLFCEKLVRRTRPRLLDEHAITDARKFKQLGVIRATALGLHVLLRHALRRPVTHHRFFEEVR